LSLAVVVVSLPSAHDARAGEHDHERRLIAPARATSREREREIAEDAEDAHGRDRAERIGHRGEDDGDEQDEHEWA
jgi:hypothetical protein